MNKLILFFALMLSCMHSVSGRAINEGDTPASSRLTLLQERLKTGDQSALEVFWKEISKKGAPLIEPIKGDTRHVLVTFLWRAKGETKNVYLFSYALTFPDEVGIRQGQLNRLLDTDVWFTTSHLNEACESVVKLRQAGLPKLYVILTTVADEANGLVYRVTASALVHSDSRNNAGALLFASE